MFKYFTEREKRIKTVCLAKVIKEVEWAASIERISIFYDYDSHDLGSEGVDVFLAIFDFGDKYAHG